MFFPGGSGYGAYGGGRRREGMRDRIGRWFKAGKKASSGPARIHTLQSGTSSKETEVDKEDEVDRILDKISERGYDALTDEEKRILYEASRN